MRRVHLIVGAGLGGLLAAHEARARGEDVLVLEAAARPGGAVGTTLLEGYRVETGAPFLRAPCPRALQAATTTAHAPVLRALQAPFALAGHGGLEAARPRGGARLRLLAEVLLPPRRPAAARRRPETLHAFAQRRFGAGLGAGCVQPLARAFLGASPLRLGIADVLPGVLALEARRGRVLPALRAALRGRAPWGWLPSGGMQALAEALADDLGAGLEFGARVGHVLPGREGGHPSVVLEDGREHGAHRVTLAVPPPEAARLLAGAASRPADLLAGVGHAPRVTVTLGWADDGPGSRLPGGAGFLRGRARLRTLGGLWWTRLDADVAPPGHALASLWFGGDDDRSVLDLGDVALRRRAVADLARVLGRRVHPTFVHIAREPRGFVLPHPGHRARWVPHERALAAAGVALA